MSDPTPTLWEVFKSIMWSFFGVAKEETRQRDFTYGKPGQFIVIGLIFTIIFIAGLYLSVKVIMYFAMS